MKVTEEVLGGSTIELDPIETIGLYKMVLGFQDDDDDVLVVRAGLQVRLSAIVGQ